MEIFNGSKRSCVSYFLLSLYILSYFLLCYDSEAADSAGKGSIVPTSFEETKIALDSMEV